MDQDNTKYQREYHRGPYSDPWLITLLLSEGSKPDGDADDVALVIYKPSAALIEIVSNDWIERFNK